MGALEWLIVVLAVVVVVVAIVVLARRRGAAITPEAVEQARSPAARRAASLTERYPPASGAPRQCPSCGSVDVEADGEPGSWRCRSCDAPWRVPGGAWPDVHLALWRMTKTRSRDAGGPP
jgi:ribosomal protein L37AE/L43A